MGVYFNSIQLTDSPVYKFVSEDLVGPLALQHHKAIRTLRLPASRATHQYTCPMDKRYVYISIVNEFYVGNSALAECSARPYGSSYIRSGLLK